MGPGDAEGLEPAVGEGRVGPVERPALAMRRVDRGRVAFKRGLGLLSPWSIIAVSAWSELFDASEPDALARDASSISTSMDGSV